MKIRLNGRLAVSRPKSHIGIPQLNTISDRDKDLTGSLFRFKPNDTTPKEAHNQNYPNPSLPLKKFFLTKI